MLKSLFIRNYALIDELTVEFPNGLVIMTGETGAGKSIIIDAAGLLLGTRASGDVVRSGADKAVVEGVFNIAGNRKVRAMLEQNDCAASEELIIRREISAKGQSRCFVNDSPATLQLQKLLGELLVDLHGQHEHQSLLRPENHIGMLDDFGGLEGMVQEFRESFTALGNLARELHGLREREQQLREKREFHGFQMQEIDAVGPRMGEEEELEAELRVLENSETLFAVTGRLYEILYEGEQSIHDQLVVARNQLQDLTEIDKEFTEAAKECSTAEAIISELAKFIQGYNARVEFNPERLEEVRARLGAIALLKKKYGGSVQSVLAFREKIATEVSLAENFDEVINKLAGDAAEAGKRCAAIAQRLSAKRYDVARKLDKAILQELAKLGIASGKFTTAIRQEEVPPDDGGKGYSVPLGKKRLFLNADGPGTRRIGRRSVEGDACLEKRAREVGPAAGADL